MRKATRHLIVVHYKWLSECYQKGTLVPADPYLVHEKPDKTILATESRAGWGSQALAMKPRLFEGKVFTISGFSESHVALTNIENNS